MTPTPLTRLRGLPNWVGDGALAAVLAALEISFQWLVDPADVPELAGFTGPSVEGVIVALLVTVPLAARRRWPIPVLMLVGVTAIVAVPLDVPLVGFGLVIGLYTVAAHCNRRDSLIILGLFAIGTVIAMLLADALRFAPINAVLFLTAWVFGDRQQARRAYTAELEAKAERLEREREQEARLAVSEERSRIARELHDVVAHSVSVMTVQAAGARRVLDRDPRRAAEALGQVERTGRQSLVELRRVLDVLRSDEEQPSFLPQPRLEYLPALVERFRDAGLSVNLDTEGDARPVASGVELSAFRIVQEALTNVLRHAGPATVTVRLRYADDGLEVDVSDDGRGPAPGSSENGQGHGLVGMHERVSLHGGLLRAGPRPGGGFQVSAWLPAEPAR